MNWRNPILRGALRLTGSEIPRRYDEILSLCRCGRSAIREAGRRKLADLLQFAYRQVPYYHEVLNEHGILKVGNEVDLDRFRDVPFLTKDILRSRFDDLKAGDLDSRRWYRNTSGGSTGEPVLFLQDRSYQAGDIAATLFFFHVAGKEMGEPELKLWGSERDIFAGSIGWKEKTENWLYNRLLLNSFRMGEAEMEEYCRQWNRFRPAAVWAYIDSAYELARFVETKGLHLHAPQAVIVTAGTVAEGMRRYIERVLGTKVLNQYGSRETGVLACECPEQHGLHWFEWKSLLEVVDAEGRPCPSGVEGEIVVTNLDNFAMPLIRFRIGDRGIVGEDPSPCRFPLRVLEKVTGRVTNHFVLADGRLIHGEYFTHLFYFRPWVKRFQVVQKRFDLVECRVVEGGKRNEDDVRDIEEKIRQVMGPECRVEFKSVEDIPRLESGKYLYTVSEVAKSGPAESSPPRFR